MRLTAEQCIDRIKNPRNRAYLQAAALQEQRLLMHCEPLTDDAPARQAIDDWKKWVSGFLPANKYNRFIQLLRFPLTTTRTTSVIWDELGKIFDAPDKSVRMEFTVPEMETDFWQDVEERLNDENYWQEQGWKAAKTRICSYLVVDLPRQQVTPRPEPYYYMLSATSVWDVEIGEKGAKVECIFIRQNRPDVKGEWVLAIEDNAYRMFHRPEGSSEWTMTSEAVHSTYTEAGQLIDGLGYAPACSFWEHEIEGTKRINKRGPLTDSLAELDWLLFWSVSKKYLDLYGAWPIVVRYKEDCKYENEHGRCDNGLIKYERPDPGMEGGWRKCVDPCPNCRDNKLLGPGTDISIDPPDPNAKVDLMENYIKFIESSNDKLEYGVAELERLERKIQVSATGRVIQEATKEAINEDQVRSQFEAQRAKMDVIRKQFEANRQFVLTTAARLRYGRYFIRGSVFFGREYFLQSADDLSNQYAAAKKNGLPEYEVDRIREAYSNTKYKSDDLQRQRSRILAELYPYPNMTVMECKGAGIELSDPEGFQLKLNFTSFIRRFERENTNIVEFGSLTDFNSKINIIHSKLLEYGRNIKPATSPQPDGKANG